jgi:hypothetical protein
MKFMKRTAVDTCLDYARNIDIMKELNTHPVMESTENYTPYGRSHDF